MSCHKTLALIAIALTGFASSNATERVALLIGNGDYGNQGAFTDLATPVKDVALVSDALVQTGFNVILVKNATRMDMELKLREFEEAIQNGGTAVFYYAGHSAQSDGAHRLFGTNAGGSKGQNLSEQAISLNNVLEALSRKKPKNSIVFLDGSREELPNEKFADMPREEEPSLANTDLVNKNLLVCYSTAPNRPALLGTDENSPYALALSSQILTENLELNRLLKNVAMTVYKASNNKQTPWWSGNLEDDFHFNIKGENPIAEAPGIEVLSSAADAGNVGEPSDTGWSLLNGGRIIASGPASANTYSRTKNNNGAIGVGSNSKNEKKESETSASKLDLKRSFPSAIYLKLRKMRNNGG